jgi:hypothetical protein
MANLYSPFASLEQEIFGKTAAPSDIEDFQLVVQGSKANLSWTQVSDLDVINGGHYWVRYSSDTSAAWGSSSTVERYVPGSTSSVLVPLLNGRYLIKAVDSSGNESVNAATFNASVDVDILNLNAVETTTQHPNFGNDTSNTGVNDTDTTNIFYDTTNQAIQLDTESLATGTHDEYYATGTNTDVIGTYDSNQESILDDNSGSNYTVYVAENIVDGASGNFDDRSGNFDDLIHTANKLTDENASFDSTWNGKTVRNVTDDTTAVVSAVDSSTVLSLDTDIFDGSEEQYRLEVLPNNLRDTTQTFTSDLVGRTVRLDDNTTATVSAFVDANNLTLSSDLMEDNNGADYHIEWGPYQIYDSTGPFTSAVVGKTIRNTTEGTSATVSALVSAYELTLDDTIFDHQDGDSYTIEVNTKVLRDTGASFDSTHLNRIIRNIDTGNQTYVVSVDSSTELTINSDIFPTDGANYKVEGDVESSGTYYFTDEYIDLGTTYTSRLLTEYTSDSFDVLELFDATGGNFDSRTGLFDGSDISSTNAQVQVRTTTDDPSSSPTWSSWINFYIGDYTARAFQFRMNLSSSNVTQNIRVDSLKVTVDMPDTVKRDYNIQTNSGTNNGTYVKTYDVPFYTVPSLGITPVDSDDKISFTINSNTESGFSVTFFDNNSSQPIQKYFNWISVGY